MYHCTSEMRVWRPIAGEREEGSGNIRGDTYLSRNNCSSGPYPSADRDCPLSEPLPLAARPSSSPMELRLMMSRDSSDSPSSSCGTNSMLLKSMLFSQLDRVLAERRALVAEGRLADRSVPPASKPPSQDPWWRNVSSAICAVLCSGWVALPPPFVPPRSLKDPQSLCRRGRGPSSHLTRDIPKCIYTI
eukprot:COSAG02_NODE_766_length_17389_cov_29.287045_9_plen_189_part_00